MELNQAYRDQLLALLPRGAAWPHHLDAVLPELLSALSEEFARVHLRALDLMAQRSPLETYELLDDWEADLGLPDSCSGSVTDTAARRAAVAARLISLGGQTPAFYLQVLQAYGIDAELVEFLPYSVEEDVDAAVTGEDWIFAWQLTLPEVTVREFGAGDGTDDTLAEWGNTFVECLIRRLAPAHTIPLLTYQ